MAGGSGGNTGRRRDFCSLEKTLTDYNGGGYGENLLYQGAAVAARHTEEAFYMIRLHIERCPGKPDSGRRRIHYDAF